jgi:hypothetical protein
VWETNYGFLVAPSPTEGIDFFVRPVPRIVDLVMEFYATEVSLHKARNGKVPLFLEKEER